MHCFLRFLKPLGLHDQRKRDPSILAAGITATAALGSAGMSAAAANANSHQGRVFSRWAVKQGQEEAARAREWTSHESELARQWEEYMYNQYNSPSAMMAQYRAAGLNPYLMGSDAPGSAMSSSAPMAPPGNQAPIVGAPPQYMPDFSGISQAGNAFMQALGVKANIASQEAMQKKELWSTAWQINRDFGRDAAMKFMKENDLFAPENRGASMGEELLVGQIMKQNQEAYYTQVMSGFYENYQKPQAEAYTEVLKKSLGKMDQEIATLRSQEKLNYETGQRVGSEIKKNLAQAFEAAQNANTIGQLRNYIVSQACMAAGISAMDYMTYFSEFSSQETVRKFQESDAGKKARFANYQVDPANNPVFGFIRGISSSLGNLPGNLSPYISRPRGNTYNVNYTPWNINNNYPR